MPSDAAHCALPLSRLLKWSDTLPLHYARCFCLHFPGHRRRRRTPQRTQAFRAIRLPLSGRYNRSTLWIRVIPLSKFSVVYHDRAQSRSWAQQGCGWVNMLQAKYAWRSMEVSSCNHRCSGKAMCITFVCVCVCSLRYAACKAHAPYCHLWIAVLYNIFPHYLIKERFFLHKTCVLFISTFVWNISVS